MSINRQRVNKLSRGIQPPKVWYICHFDPTFGSPVKCKRTHEPVTVDDCEKCKDDSCLIIKTQRIDSQGNLVYPPTGADNAQ